MNRRPRVVIVGLGDTGVLVAVQLARSCDVVGIGTRPGLVSGQELGNRLTDPEHWRRNFFVPFDRFRALDRVRLVHGEATAVDTGRRVVRVALARGGERFEPYDALVIASGVTSGFWRSPVVEDLAAVEEEMGRVAERFASAGTVAVVGGGATGVAVATSLGRRGTGSVHLFHSGDEPLPGYHSRVRQRIVQELDRAGVHRHPGHRALIEGALPPDRLSSGPVSWTTGQAPFDADLVLWAVGSVRPNTSFLPPDLLDDDGFVLVDEHLRVPGHEMVFAVGDVAASDPARSSARNWGYLLVAHNVKAALGGRSGRLWRYHPPPNRWGSVLGVQDDGMVVFQPDGRSFRVPRWAVQPTLFSLWLNTVLYRGVRRPADAGVPAR